MSLDLLAEDLQAVTDPAGVAVGILGNAIGSYAGIATAFVMQAIIGQP